MIEGQVVDGLFVRSRVLPIELPRAGQERGCVLKLGYDARVGGSTIYDRSGKGNNGTITGATWVRLPSGLWALNFDGDDYVTIASTIQPMAAQGSIEFWVYMANWADGVQRVLFDLSLAGGDHRILVRKQADNTPNFYIATLTVQVNIIGSALSGSGWKHWAVKYASNDCFFRINGASIGTDTLADMPTFTNQVTRWGATFDATAGTMANGQMALLRITNINQPTSFTDGNYNRERHLFNV